MTAEGSGRVARGLALGVVSAFCFSTAGPLAAGLLATGWSPLALVVVRSAVGAMVLLAPALLGLAGRFGSLRENWRVMARYGVLVVALTQIGYFNAVQYLQVAQALLLEFLAPVVLVGVLWVWRGERPGLRILLGSLLAIGGLLLVLRVFEGQGGLDPRGVVWGMVALIGNSAYFLFSSDASHTLPAPVLAAGGLAVGTFALAVAGAVGLLPFTAASEPVWYAGHRIAHWVALLALGMMASALSYLTGIQAARSLGPRLSSFVGLGEVLFAAALAALPLGQLLGAAQAVGGALVVGGVVLVRLGERHVGGPKPAGPG